MPPIHLTLIEDEIKALTDDIKIILNPSQRFLLGPAVTVHFFQDSDFDFLVVCSYENQARNIWRLFPKVRRRSKSNLDFITTFEEEISIKSRIGGIAMVAFSEGRRLI
jgi:hypothetical protein